MDHKLSEHSVAGQQESNSQIHSPLIIHCFNLKTKEKKKFSLRDTDLALPPTATWKTHPVFLQLRDSPQLILYVILQ